MKTALKYWHLNSGGASPKNISGLLAWWDNDLSTITKNGSNQVSAWSSKVNSYSLVQSGADSLKPVYTTNRYNGQAGLVFNGTNQFLSSNKIDQIQNIQNLTIFSVGKSARAMQYSSSSTIITGLTINNLASTQCQVFIRNGGTDIATVTTSTDYGYGIMRFDGTQAVNADRVRLNYKQANQTLSFTSSPAATTENAATTFEIMKYLTNYYAGDFIEMGIYTKTLSDLEMAILNSYLLSKYGS